MRVDSQEFTDLMKKWSDEAWAEEMGNAHDDYLANEDMHGRLIDSPDYKLAQERYFDAATSFEGRQGRNGY